MTWQALVWELVKLSVQAGTAYLVARTAVRWALIRFKQEKVWERRLSAQVDVIVALTDLRKFYGRWIDENEGHTPSSEEAGREHADRYRTSSRKLEEAMALGQLLLPETTTNVLLKLEKQRANLFTGNQYDDYSEQYRLLNYAINDLIRDGRQMLP